jgi:transcription elongation GreA/GreB family factor
MTTLKQTAFELLRKKTEAELHKLSASQTAAQEGATHEETRQEDPKDTRAIEAQYLARGLAERVESMRSDVALLAGLQLKEFGPDDGVEVTALVKLEGAHGAEAIYLLVPCAGGETLEVDGRTIRTLTPMSPLGQALIGRYVEDEVTLELPDRRMDATIRWIR